MSFSKNIKKHTDDINKSFERKIRGAAIACFKGIILQSPVDEGRFRANWLATQTAPASRIVDRKDKTGANAVNAMTTVVLELPEWHQFYLTNNLPYSETLEYGGYPKSPKKGSRVKGNLNRRGGYKILSTGGFSRQAPQGMVRINLARTAQLLRSKQ